MNLIKHKIICILKVAFRYGSEVMLIWGVLYLSLFMVLPIRGESVFLYVIAWLESFQGQLSQLVITSFLAVFFLRLLHKISKKIPKTTMEITSTRPSLIKILIARSNIDAIFIINIDAIFMIAGLLVLIFFSLGEFIGKGFVSKYVFEIGKALLYIGFGRFSARVKPLHMKA